MRSPRCLDVYTRAKSKFHFGSSKTTKENDRLCLPIQLSSHKTTKIAESAMTSREKMIATRSQSYSSRRQKFRKLRQNQGLNGNLEISGIIDGPRARGSRKILSGKTFGRLLSERLKYDDKNAWIIRLNVLREEVLENSRRELVLFRNRLNRIRGES